MTAILYPVAKDPDLALNQPMGQAARAREAQDIAGEAVRFVSGPAGPSYATLELAQAACRANLAEAWCQLAERVQAVRPPPPVAPLMENGRRWPAPPLEAPATLWQLQVSYWCPVSAISTTETAQARQARRQVREPVDHQTLSTLTRQPLRAIKPQQPLDIGLFERRLPESPHIVVPDE